MLDDGFTKRIIPCLDVKNGRVVKGVQFVNLRDAGDPIEQGIYYSSEGADELCFLDITASVDKRKTIVELVKNVASNIHIPFTVGGGIATVEDVFNLLNNGADKVCINTAGFKNPQLFTDCAKIFGSQCIVAAIDARYNGELYEVFLNGGRTATGVDAISWAVECAERGAGEILLTSMDKDGTKDGFELELTSQVSMKVNIPVIASGGVGNMQHMLEGFTKGKADAVLAASIFHFKEFTINEVKKYLSDNGVPVRLI